MSLSMFPGSSPSSISGLWRLTVERSRTRPTIPKRSPCTTSNSFSSIDLAFLLLSQLAGDFQVMHWNEEERRTMAGPSQAVDSSEHPLLIRRATPADAEVCGRICFDAFERLSRQHNF